MEEDSCGNQVTLERELPVSLNVVISRDNIDTFTETIDYIVEEFPTLEG